MHKIHYVSGLPRSGSTLMMNLLAQNPEVHATPTSACIEGLFLIRNNWNEWTEHKADKAAADSKNLKRVLNAYLQAYHDTDKPVVIDKGRGWLSILELVEFVSGSKAKVIVCVRDIAEILASFEVLYRKNSHLNNVPGSYFPSQTIEGRCNHWTLDSSIVGLSYNRLKDAIGRGLGDRLHIVEFEDLTNNPKETMDKIWRFLDMEPITHDFNNVEQVTFEDDSIHHALGLHDIRKSVKPVPKNAAAILGRNIADKYHRAEFWR